MFPNFVSRTEYDRQIRRTLNEMETYNPQTDEYGYLLERVQKLSKMREEFRPDRIDPNTVLTIAANIVGIVVIVRHEEFNVVASKALGFVIKPR